MSKQIVSRERVKKHGEVFTPLHIVEEMHELIPSTEWARKDFIYLEPTCGKGVFIIAAIKKKMQHGLTIEQAVNTVFGMDIQKDNIEDSQRLIKELVYESTKDKNVRQRCLNIATHNVFRVTDSLLWMEQDISKVPEDIWPDWYSPWEYPTGSLIENLPFKYDDPTCQE